MSTYYYGNLYKKKKENWCLIEKNISMNCVKNFLDCWNIEADEIYIDDNSLNELNKNNTFYYTYKFIGLLEKEKINSSSYINKYIEQNKKHNDNDGITFIDEDFDTLETYINDIKKETTNELIKNHENYYDVYVRVKMYYKGDFYNSSSFDKIISESKEELKLIEKNRNKWEEISTSLDFLKLTQEEKENVFSSFEYKINDEDNYFENRLHSAEMLKHTLELFTDFDDKENDVLFYIYSDSSCYMEDLPDWLNDKISMWF